MKITLGNMNFLGVVHNFQHFQHFHNSTKSGDPELKTLLIALQNINILGYYLEGEGRGVSGKVVAYFLDCLEKVEHVKRPSISAKRETF